MANGPGLSGNNRRVPELPSDQPSTGRPDSRAAALAVARHLRLDLGPLRKSRELRLLFVGSGVSFAGSMMTYVALPFQASRITHSSLVVGLLSLSELIALLLTALAGAVAWGVGITLFGLVSSLPLAALMLVLAGAADMVSGIGRSTMWNQSIPDALRGRLSGIEMLSYTSGPTLGNVESGLVESFAGLRAAIVSGGVACIAGSALLSLLLPAFWHYRSEQGSKLRVPQDPGSP
jgi:MFS family permease